MKTTRITAMLAALAMLCPTATVLPEMANEIAMTASAAETTNTTYEQLTYKTYSDHIEITDCDTSVTEVVIPAEIDGLPVTRIDNYAFKDCHLLTAVTIPDSVKSLGALAFSECDSLTSITIPDSVTSIGEGAFEDCASLSTITLPKNLIRIRADVFEGCIELTTVTIPDTVSRIGSRAFCGCLKLTSVTIPDSVTSIESEAFSECSQLTSITIPDGVTSIGAEAFSGCSQLTSITIPDSVTSIGGAAFIETPWLDAKREENPLVVVNNILIDARACKGDVVIPDNVTSMAAAAFSYNDDITSVTIGKGITTIKYDTFYSCDALTSVTIPENVKAIDSAFSKCSVLESVIIRNPECDIDDSEATFSNVHIWVSENIEMPDGSIEHADNIEIKFDGTIYGYEGSTAQAYAKEYGRKFVALEGEPPTEIPVGNINNDGAIDATDAAILLSAAAAAGAGGESGLTEAQIKAADLDGNGTFDASDASLILMYAAYAGAGGDLSITDYLATL